MSHASTFDTQKFASIIKEQVEDISQKRSGDTRSKSLKSAFAYWCVKAISVDPLKASALEPLEEKEVDRALLICEGDGIANEPLDAAWVYDGVLYLLQAEYEPPGPGSIEEGYSRIPSFGEMAPNQLERGFDRLLVETKTAGLRKGNKFLHISELYKKAVAEGLRIELVVAISGNPKKSLVSSVNAMNSKFDSNRNEFPKHHMAIYDLERLNQKVSDNLAQPPGIVYVDTSKNFEMENTQGGAYAVAATIKAREIIRIRDECGYSIYHSNFRFMLTRGVAHAKIVSTLRDPLERLNFWRYNNGITISCETVRRVGQSNKFEIAGLQVVNGLQTIETLYENRNHSNWFNGVDLLVRIIPTRQSKVDDSGQARLLEERIAEYSNSQTPITPRDLRANDAVQRIIQLNMLEIYDLLYVRKSGKDPGSRGRPSRDRIENDEAAQAALSFWYGLSKEAKARKKLIFERSTSAIPGFYDKIFTDKTTTEYVLWPYLLWNLEYAFIDKVQDESRWGAYRSLDLMALAVLGDAFKRLEKLDDEPTSSAKVTNALRTRINFLRQENENRKKALAARIWKPIFETLYSIVLEERKSEARRRGLKPEDITLRNVIVKMNYMDDRLKREIWSNRKIRMILKSENGLTPNP